MNNVRGRYVNGGCVWRSMMWQKLAEEYETHLIVVFPDGSFTSVSHPAGERDSSISRDHWGL